jgi:hypothetical protein
MPRVCNVADVPVGGIYQEYDERAQKPTGPTLTCLAKGVSPGTGMGYNVIARIKGKEIHDHHMKFRSPVYWINDEAAADATPPQA